MEIQPRDYRAWYGLGQTYELLARYPTHMQRIKEIRPLCFGDGFWFCCF